MSRLTNNTDKTMLLKEMRGGAITNAHFSVLLLIGLLRTVINFCRKERFSSWGECHGAGEWGKEPVLCSIQNTGERRA